MLKGWPDYEKYVPTDDVRLISDGNDFFSLLEEMIRNAHSTFHLQTYIFDDDYTGRRIINAMKEAAARGVKIFLLVDSFGSNRLTSRTSREMRESGIHFRKFSPVMSFRPLSVGRRLHHKIAVADSETALVGGINIADKYRDLPGQRGWLDFAVFVKGSVASDLHDICNKVWKRRIGRRKRPENRGKAGRKYLVRIRENDWMRHKSRISYSYKQAFRNADKSIVMVAAYFLPGRQFRNLLKKAAARGVEIHIVLARRSDVSMVLYATRFLYSWMLRNNINIYEWHLSNVHGKVAVIDRTWSTVGSFNLNYLSLYGSIELNLYILSTGFSADFHRKIFSLMDAGCESVSAESFRKRTSRQMQFIYWCSYQLTRLSMLLAVYFTRPGKYNKLKE